MFSTSTEFESERGHSKFSAYALLEHNWDFHEAAKALGRLGYGEQGTPADVRKRLATGASHKTEDTSRPEPMALEAFSTA